MIRKGYHECSRSAEVTLDGRRYSVEYTLRGKCYYDEGRLYGPPENCYPSESEGEILELRLDSVWGEEEGVPCVGDIFLSRIRAEIETLPLDDYLLESWMESDYDYGPEE